MDKWASGHNRSHEKVIRLLLVSTRGQPLSALSRIRHWPSVRRVPRTSGPHSSQGSKINIVVKSGHIVIGTRAHTLTTHFHTHLPTASWKTRPPTLWTRKAVALCWTILGVLSLVNTSAFLS